MPTKTLVARQTKADSQRKTCLIKGYLPAAFQERVQEAVKSYPSASEFVAMAVKEKLARDLLDRRREELLASTLSRVEQVLSGQRTVQRLNFAATAALARLMLQQFPELGSATKHQNELTIPPRMEKFMRMIAEEFR